MRSSLSAALAVLALLVPRAALADTPAAAAPKPVDESPGGYAQIFGALSFGKGLRFNNPYRLATELGSDAQSLSLTAAYVDFAAAMSFGAPRGFQHGGVIHAGTGLEGVGQAYLSASYELLYRRHAEWMFTARAGPVFVFAPDINTGGELATGFSYFVTGGLGLTSELAFDLFYGAATLDKTYTVTPTLSLQLGVIVDFEVLP
jgi:hypothetical protein